MADYIASARSNYFRVRDVEAYSAFCEAWDVTSITEDASDGNTLHGFLCNGGIPTERETDDEEGDDAEPHDFQVALAGQLCEGEVAVLMEIGHEKQRNVFGYALAINSAGAVVEVSLADIYEKAKQANLGANMTQCEY